VKKMSKECTLTLKENWGKVGHLKGNDMDIIITSGDHYEFDGDLNHRVIELKIRGWKIINDNIYNSDNYTNIKIKLVRDKFICPICWSPNIKIGNKNLECKEKKCKHIWIRPDKRFKR